MRLTTAQAIVRYLIAQRTVIDGAEGPLFPGVFAIFGHGNVTCLGHALHAAGDELPTWRARTSRAWRWPRSPTPRRCGAPDHGRHLVDRTGATNMVTAAGVAMANRLPVLLLSGDTFASRLPDPVLQQVEHFGDPSTTVNDAFRPSCATGTASPGPSRSCRACRRPSPHCSIRRTAGRPSSPCPRTSRARRTTSRPACSSPSSTSCAGRARAGGARCRGCSDPPGQVAADRRRRGRALLVRRNRAGGVRRTPWHPDRGDRRR